MHEPRAAGFIVTLAFARVFGALDAASTTIAGFALLAGTRAFTFTALLAWREPVLGGAGLVLLGLVGWLRWCCRNRPLAALTGLLRTSNRTIVLAKGLRGRAQGNTLDLQSRVFAKQFILAGGAHCCWRIGISAFWCRFARLTKRS
jgi:hypothetical protein